MRACVSLVVHACVCMCVFLCVCLRVIFASSVVSVITKRFRVNIVSLSFFLNIFYVPFLESQISAIGSPLSNLESRLLALGSRISNLGS